LWISGILGDERFTVGAVLVATWVLPTLLRRVRLRRAPVAVPVAPKKAAAAVMPVPVPVPVPEPVTATVKTARQRRRSSRNGLTRARGLHG
jgi:hypothetical protein